MSSPLAEAVQAALKTTRLPGSDKTYGGAGAVGAVSVDGGKAAIILSAPVGASADEVETIRAHAEKVAAAVEGVTEALAVLTGPKGSRPAPPQMAPTGKGPKAGRPTPPPPTPTPIPGVRHVIAVASGKGGVGKSTTSINLALALKDLGLKVGVLDADIFGPSLPTLVGLTDRPRSEDGKIVPLRAHGLTLMSIGFMIDPNDPVVWRGPRVMGATEQMLHEVKWGELDVLIVDMPPGTGDVQLTMVQRAPLTGAVIVSTPQDLALIDARKGIAMFEKVKTPILGIIENMSYFHCPSCGERSDIFGHGGAREEAERLKVPFLGEIPLAMPIRASADAGRPTMISTPDSPEGARYRAIAETLHIKIAAEG